MTDVRVVRLTESDCDAARKTFAMMAQVLGDGYSELSEAWVKKLLRNDSFWAVAAFAGGEAVGGVTAHTLPMTNGEFSELFLYDVAVARNHQRLGIGRRMIQWLRQAASAAGIQIVFVPAENKDIHALDFYKGLGGEPLEATFFTFAPLPKARTGQMLNPIRESRDA